RESVSYTAYGLDQCRLLGQRLDLVAEAPDVDLQVLRLVPVLGSPHAGEQRVVRERLARVRRELREKIELGGSEMDVLSSPTHASRGPIEHKALLVDRARAR